ncbi:L-serine ammonia-lyase [Moraxella sp. FZLJ2107]|uniref:L-serine ammonia-lyase n=1 Tax=unclassified Moraxella TaxID=2685852 RepID=UPI0020C9094F|nr:MULTISPECIES: L-serine ammonia-lyase [unclassified Moraxella]UTO05371.1 L-serine ammonia-lyase [Moraxella sp. FZLJ2107]UTO22106.1 L-serine ammonia-lyase [Moraxella sp. FZLJ2109]
MISVFELFKIGIGPSSSHTVGPMVAANRFLAELGDQLPKVIKLHIELYGSLSSTGKGHATDTAILLGLLGHEPRSIDTTKTDKYLAPIFESQTLNLGGTHEISFDVHKHLLWDDNALSAHPNGMRLVAHFGDAKPFARTYYSIGGGFIKDEFEIHELPDDTAVSPYPYDFNSAEMLAKLCAKHDMRISDIIMANETAVRTEDEVKEYLNEIWHTMQACVTQGCKVDGILPGGLNVKRRAKALYEQLSKEYGYSGNGGLLAMDWVNLYALAVNEENAAGGKVVTAPTNGAAGIIPAVLHYYRGFIPSFSFDGVREFLLVAGAVGALIKQNASISGAEVGCQGEVGSACAMAAAGLAHVLGGSVAQCLNAAEIGLEHNLGLTCDPIAGLVQVPCIERNAMASVKAINAARLALRGDGSHHVSLDKAIATMKATGMDMMDKYKETAKGGLAIHATDAMNRIDLVNIGSGFSQC